MQAYFRQLFEYDKWASQTLLDKFDKQFPQNERIYELMSYLLSAQKVWLDRCLALPQTMPIWRDRLPDEMRNDMETYNLAWIDLIDQLTPTQFENTITYTNTRGDTFNTRLTDIITHVLNHGTHHRGQIMMLMKEEGFILPNIDYITYVR